MRAAFARVQRDARHVAQRILEIVDALLLDHFGRHHIYGLRRVEDLGRQKVDARALRRHDDGFDRAGVRLVERELLALRRGHGKAGPGEADGGTHEPVARLGGNHKAPQF